MVWSGRVTEGLRNCLESSSEHRWDFWPRALPTPHCLKKRKGKIVPLCACVIPSQLFTGVCVGRLSCSSQVNGCGAIDFPESRKALHVPSFHVIVHLWPVLQILQQILWSPSPCWVRECVNQRYTLRTKHWLRRKWGGWRFNKGNKTPPIGFILGPILAPALETYLCLFVWGFFACNPALGKKSPKGSYLPASD